MCEGHAGLAILEHHYGERQEEGEVKGGEGRGGEGEEARGREGEEGLGGGLPSVSGQSTSSSPPGQSAVPSHCCTSQICVPSMHVATLSPRHMTPPMGPGPVNHAASSAMPACLPACLPRLLAARATNTEATPPLQRRSRPTQTDQRGPDVDTICRQAHQAAYDTGAFTSRRLTQYSARKHTPTV